MILSLVTLIPAVVVVTSSNIVRAALSLVPTFLGVTGLYVMLQAAFVAALLFCLGLYGVLTRRNAVAILMGIELMLNAANINLVAFNRFVAPAAVAGQVFALVIITLAACEAAVGLALVMAAYRSLETIQVDEINLMKW